MSVNKKSASWVPSELVKSDERREIEKAKVSVKNGQLRLPPRMAHTKRLNQKNVLHHNLLHKFVLVRFILDPCIFM